MTAAATTTTAAGASLIALLERMKAFLSFGPEDAANLRSLRGIVEKYGPSITDRFYDRLGKTTETAKHLEGRVEGLKKTHRAWMQTLVGGDYGEAYMQARWRIGLAHVRVGLEPYWVEVVMSFIRTEMLDALSHEIADPKEVANKHRSFCKACDLDLLIINLSYSEDRLDRITDFTGMKRALVENIIRLPKK